MTKGILIVTSEATKDFLRDCLISCHQEKYPIMVVSNNYLPDTNIANSHISYFVHNQWNGFELGGIEQAMKEFDEFILLQVTCIIKDQKLFDECFDFDGSVYFTDRLSFHYGAKFRREILEKIGVPRVNTREEAISQEWNWGHLYFDTETKWKYLEPIMEAGNHDMPIVERHGRKGILLETPWMEKHKTNF